MSQITDILLNSLVTPDVDTVYTQPITETHRQWAEQIEQAITDLMNDAIGPDFVHGDKCATVLLGQRRCTCHVWLVNKTKADIRSKLGLTTKEDK